MACLAVAAVGLLWAIGKGHTYGLMLALGLLVASAVTLRLARRDNLPAQAVSTLAIIALVAGILGARLAYVVEHWSEMAGPPEAPRPMSEALLDAASIASGGLVFDGGLILAVLAVLLYLWRRKLPVRRFLDLLAIAAMIGLAFGRIGCFFNGCCYGGSCGEHWPLAVHYPYAASPLVYPHEGKSPYPASTTISLVYDQQYQRNEGVRVPNELLLSHGEGRPALKLPDRLHTEGEFTAARNAWSLPVHPAQLYACALDFLLAAALWRLWKGAKVPGAVFAWLLVLYPVMRFGLEFIRHDNPDRTLTPAQLKCIVLFVAGAIVFMLMRRLRGRELKTGVARPPK
jgi:phosphatidylglycerol:prolipoprotein diacylglycerol transferase